MFFIILQNNKCEWKGTAPSCGADARDCVGSHSHYWAWSKCGDGKQCTSGRKAFCCTSANPYVITYWTGTAPFCKGTCHKCEINGDHCIVENKCGDGSRCWSGKKALCGRQGSVTLSKLEELVKMSEDTNAKEQSVLLMGEPPQVDAMGESGLVLAYVNYDKIIMDN